MKKIKDPVLLGIVAGLLGNAAKTAGNLTNRHILGFSDTTYSEISSGLFMTRKERKKKTGILVGVLGDFVISAGLGVPIVYLLKYTGKDYAMLKGLAISQAAWISLFGTIGRGMGENKGVFPLSAETNLSAFLNHSWYGMITALAASKLGDDSLFRGAAQNRPKNRPVRTIRTYETEKTNPSPGLFSPAEPTVLH